MEIKLKASTSTTVAAALLFCGLFPSAHSREIKVATWNLGWHMDSALAATWMKACDAKFALDAGSKLWKTDPTGDKRGWDLKWGRKAPIVWDIAVLPPCDVYQEVFKVVAVTTPAYERRQQQIALVLAKEVAADVIAFQEVSGKQAVLDVLPDRGKDYHVCSFDGYKVQRLAFAWRRSLGDATEGCEPYAGLSLPKREEPDRPRPGLSVGLTIDGKLIRFLTVHLKSSCVSPIESVDENGKGRLAGTVLPPTEN